VTFFESYLVLAEIYVLAALSTNLLVGIAGIFSISQAAVFGVGAYLVAGLMMQAGFSFALALVVAAFGCIVLDILISLPSLRVAGDYFVVTSFGIQILATAVFTNWTAGTGGANGLPGIPPASLAGAEIVSTSGILALTTALLAIGIVAFWLFMRAPFGRLIHAVREDETAVAALGKPVLSAKVAAAALSGAFVGVAGGLYAVFLSFIDPSSFDLDASVLLLTMVVVGGARTLKGAILGPFLLVGLPQVLDLINIPTTIAAPARQLLYGGFLVLFMLFRPQGILGERL
jgi:branched-chain amino acid transport system permease protein